MSVRQNRSFVIQTLPVKCTERPRPLLDRKLPPHPLGKYRRGRGGRPAKKPRGPSCRGGYTVTSPQGYVLEWSPDHPSAVGQKKRVPQHRLVMECVLGRLLRPEEVVHHENHVRHDNRRRNLRLMESRSAHMQEHAEDIRARNLVPLTEAAVRRALRGRTTLEAAAILGVHHMTLRSRFDHLLSKRRSPGAGFPPEFVEKVRALAADPDVTTTMAHKILKTTAIRLRVCRKLHGIEWCRREGVKGLQPMSPHRLKGYGLSR